MSGTSRPLLGSHLLLDEVEENAHHLIAFLGRNVQEAAERPRLDTLVSAVVLGPDDLPQLANTSRREDVAFGRPNRNDNSAVVLVQDGQRPALGAAYGSPGFPGPLVFVAVTGHWQGEISR